MHYAPYYALCTMLDALRTMHVKLMSYHCRLVAFDDYLELSPVLMLALLLIHLMSEMKPDLCLPSLCLPYKTL